MSSPSLHQLERDVEAARSKLTSDLATLRAPATISEFTEGLKKEAYSAKDELIDKAKSSAHTMFEEFVDDLKGKAAANPAAALAIAAGVAWQMIRRPPIASALVGLGLVSLWRTSPMPRNGSQRRQRQTWLSYPKAKKPDRPASAESEMCKCCAQDIRVIFHLPWPGIGNIAKEGDGYRFVPTPILPV